VTAVQRTFCSKGTCQQREEKGGKEGDELEVCWQASFALAREEADRSRFRLTFRSGAVTSGCRGTENKVSFVYVKREQRKRARRTHEERLKRPDEVEETDWRAGRRRKEVSFNSSKVCRGSEYAHPISG